MQRLAVPFFIVLVYLLIYPLAVNATDIYGIEVGNSQLLRGTYLLGEAQVQNSSFEQGTTGWSMSKTLGTICSFSISTDAYEGTNSALLDITKETIK